MNQPVITCPRCGAIVKISVGPGPLRCEYCDTPLQVGIANQADSPPARQATAISTDFASVGDNLPGEYRQLMRPKPSTRLDTWGPGMLFGLVWTVFSSIFIIIGLVIFINNTIDYNRLSQEGVPARATITKLEIDDSGDSTSYYVYYQFTGKLNGASNSFNDRGSLSYSLYRSLKMGQQIDILYAASDPGLSVIKTEFRPPDALFPLAFIGMGGLFVLIGIWMLSNAIDAHQNLKLLRANGHPARAVIFDRWQDKDSDGDSTYFVAFAFDVSGKTITHSEQNKPLYDKYRIGDTLSIKYLSDNPTICHAWAEH